MQPKRQWSLARELYHTLYRAIQRRRSRTVALEGLSATGTSTTATLSVTAPLATARSGQMRLGSGEPSLVDEAEILDDPSTADKREAAVFYFVYTTTGGWLGSLVHHPWIGTIAGIVLAWRDWRPRPQQTWHQRFGRRPK